MISAKIIADSKNPSGIRLTTFELIYPRYIHPQVLTHRVMSRNSASSRAIPVKKMIKRITECPVEPVHWGKNQSGMQAYEELSGWRKAAAKWVWHRARKDALKHARRLEKLGAHKQFANRILEPYLHITTIVTATEFSNFFKLRCGDAQPEIRELANKMREAYKNHTPKQLREGEWHTPYVELEDRTSPLYVDSRNKSDFKKISAARCARVSYVLHDGTRDLEKDLELFNRLVTNGHWSPLEHVAQASIGFFWSGNIRGFIQYRKEMEEKQEEILGKYE